MLNCQNDLNELVANEDGTVSVSVSAVKSTSSSTSSTRQQIPTSSPSSFLHQRALAVAAAAPSASAAGDEAFRRGALGMGKPDAHYQPRDPVRFYSAGLAPAPVKNAHQQPEIRRASGHMWMEALVQGSPAGFSRNEEGGFGPGGDCRLSDVRA